MGLVGISSNHGHSHGKTIRNHHHHQDPEGGSSVSELESIDASRGWWPLPNVKLASWDPDNELQWNVSTGKRFSFFVCCLLDVRVDMPVKNRSVV